MIYYTCQDERLINAKQAIESPNFLLWSRNINADQKHILNDIILETMLYEPDRWIENE